MRAHSVQRKTQRNLKRRAHVWDDEEMARALDAGAGGEDSTACVALGFAARYRPSYSGIIGPRSQQQEEEAWADALWYGDRMTRRRQEPHPVAWRQSGSSEEPIELVELSSGASGEVPAGSVSPAVSFSSVVVLD